MNQSSAVKNVGPSYQHLRFRGMSRWPSSKATRVLATLQRLGWQIKRQSGSHGMPFRCRA
jgi:hypothetical protein